MGRYFNYTISLIGLAIMLEIAGIRTGAESLLNLVGISLENGFNWSASNFYNAVFGSGSVFTLSRGILIGILGGVIIGAITRTPPENYIILPFITATSIFFIAVFGNVINYVFATFPDQTWLQAIILVILGALGASYVLTAIEFFRGTD